MKINIHCIGHLKEKYWLDAINEYSKRISRFADIKIIEYPDVPYKEGISQLEEEKIKSLECKKALDNLKDNEYLIALDLNKEEMDSIEFSSFIMKSLERGRSSISFIIGGSLGLSKEIKKRANASISFSKMTFPHQMMRVILLEQIYRAFKIEHHETYHK